MIHTLRSRAELILSDLAEFWIANTLDRDHGGFIGRIDGEGVTHPTADKGVILNTRILWSFSALYQLSPKEEYLIMAQRAYQYVQQYFIDESHGGLYWMLDHLGTVTQDKKQVYAQAFGIYSYAAYYGASGSRQSLEQAKEWYEMIESKAKDKLKGGYLEAYSRDWQLLEDLRLSDKDANEKKTMNTHLHILEAYTELYRHWPDPSLRQSIVELIDIFLDHIINMEGFHLHLFMDEDWKVKSHEQSYGHDIEASWLIYEAAELLNDQKLLDQVKSVIIQMADITLGQGVNDQGAVVYEGKNGTWINQDLHWWVQAEAVVGFFNAYSLTKDYNYLRAAERALSFIEEKLIDKNTGEWYWSVLSDGRIDTQNDIVGPWKAPYHNMRMCIELIKRLQ